jgi:hypothetical protein
MDLNPMATNEMLNEFLMEKSFFLNMAFAVEDFINDDSGDTRTYERLVTSFELWKGYFNGKAKVGGDTSGQDNYLS